jgi:myosin heavy subunit
MFILDKLMTTKPREVKGTIRSYLQGLTDEESARKNSISLSTVERIKRRARERDPDVLEIMRNMPEIDQLREVNRLIKATGALPEEILRFGATYQELQKEGMDPLKAKESYVYWDEEANKAYGEAKEKREEKDGLEKEIKGLENKKRDLNEEIKDLKDERESKSEELKRALREKYKKTIENINSEISRLKREAKDLDDYVAPLRTLSSYGIEDVGRAVSFYKTTHDHLIKEGAGERDVAGLIEKLLGSYMSLPHLINELEGKRRRKEAEVERLKSEEDGLVSNIDELKSRIEDLKKVKSSGEEELERLKDESGAILRQMKSMSADIKFARAMRDFLVIGKTGELAEFARAEEDFRKTLYSQRVWKSAVRIWGEMVKDRFVSIGDHNFALMVKDAEIGQLNVKAEQLNMKTGQLTSERDDYKAKYELFMKFMRDPDSMTKEEKEELMQIGRGIENQRAFMEALKDLASLAGAKFRDWFWSKGKGS